jgi:hypothetical protein
VASRTRGRSALVVGCLLAALALGAYAPQLASASGLGNNNSFNELAAGQPESTKTTSTTSTTSNSTSESGSSNSRTLILVATGAAIVLLCGIGYVIIRDARRVAPAVDDELIEARAGHDAAVRLRKRRAQAKAARKQRRRNR